VQGFLVNVYLPQLRTLRSRMEEHDQLQLKIQNTKKKFDERNKAGKQIHERARSDSQSKKKKKKKKKIRKRKY
jgi:hypothetical protein